MSLNDSLVADEKIVFESRKHWIAPVRDSGLAALLILGAYLLGWVSPNAEGGFLGSIGRLLDLIRTGLFLVGVGMIVYNIVAWRTAQFAVTNRRVLREEGLISHRSSSTYIESVTDVKAKFGLVGRALGYGDLEIITQSGDAGADAFRTITQPAVFQIRIMQQKDLLRTQPSAAAAPVATAPATMAAAPAASVAPAAPDPAAALTSLADLRDRGIITDAEYTAKRQEVLARI